jgi:integrase
MVAVYIYAGLRREEATWLMHEDVDMDRKLIRVRAKTIEGQAWQPKTKRNRVVPISDALFAILAAYHAAQECVWFLPSPTGRRWDVDNFSQDLAEINKANGLDWTCLDFRHTFGSQLAQKGESLFKIATLMGNSPEICRRHYAALIPEEMADVVEFVRPDAPGPGDDTKAMLKAILEKLEAGDEKSVKVPLLRIVRSGEPA